MSLIQEAVSTYVTPSMSLVVNRNPLVEFSLVKTSNASVEVNRREVSPPSTENSVLKETKTNSDNIQPEVNNSNLDNNGIAKAEQCVTTGKEEVESIDGIKFVSFENESDMVEYSNLESEYVSRFRKTIKTKFKKNLSRKIIGSIVPTKTKDITKIKGWKSKIFSQNEFDYSFDYEDEEMNYNFHGFKTMEDHEGLVKDECTSGSSDFSFAENYDQTEDKFSGSFKFFGDDSSSTRFDKSGTSEDLQLIKNEKASCSFSFFGNFGAGKEEIIEILDDDEEEAMNCAPLKRTEPSADVTMKDRGVSGPNIIETSLKISELFEEKFGKNEEMTAPGLNSAKYIRPKIEVIEIEDDEEPIVNDITKKEGSSISENMSKTPEKKDVQLEGTLGGDKGEKMEVGQSDFVKKERRMSSEVKVEKLMSPCVDSIKVKTIKRTECAEEISNIKANSNRLNIILNKLFLKLLSNDQLYKNCIHSLERKTSEFQGLFQSFSLDNYLKKNSKLMINDDLRFRKTYTKDEADQIVKSLPVTSVNKKRVTPKNFDPVKRASNLASLQSVSSSSGSPSRKAYVWVHGRPIMIDRKTATSKRTVVLHRMSKGGETNLADGCPKDNEKEPVSQREEKLETELVTDINLIKYGFYQKYRDKFPKILGCKSVTEDHSKCSSIGTVRLGMLVKVGHGRPMLREVKDNLRTLRKSDSIVDSSWARIAASAVFNPTTKVQTVKRFIVPVTSQVVDDLLHRELWAVPKVKQSSSQEGDDPIFKVQKEKYPKLIVKDPNTSVQILNVSAYSGKRPNQKVPDYVENFFRNNCYKKGKTLADVFIWCCCHTKFNCSCNAPIVCLQNNELLCKPLTVTGLSRKDLGQIKIFQKKSFPKVQLYDGNEHSARTRGLIFSYKRRNESNLFNIKMNQEISNVLTTNSFIKFPINLLKEVLPKSQEIVDNIVISDDESENDLSSNIDCDQVKTPQCKNVTTSASQVDLTDETEIAERLTHKNNGPKKKGFLDYVDLRKKKVKKYTIGPAHFERKGGYRTLVCTNNMNSGKEMKEPVRIAAKSSDSSAEVKKENIPEYGLLCTTVTLGYLRVKEFSPNKISVEDPLNSYLYHCFKNLDSANAWLNKYFREYMDFESEDTQLRWIIAKTGLLTQSKPFDGRLLRDDTLMVNKHQQIVKKRENSEKYQYVSCDITPVLKNGLKRPLPSNSDGHPLQFKKIRISDIVNKISENQKINNENFQKIDKFVKYPGEKKQKHLKNEGLTEEQPGGQPTTSAVKSPRFSTVIFAKDGLKISSVRSLANKSSTLTVNTSVVDKLSVLKKSFPFVVPSTSPVTSQNKKTDCVLISPTSNKTLPLNIKSTPAKSILKTNLK